MLHENPVARVTTLFVICASSLISKMFHTLFAASAALAYSSASVLQELPTTLMLTQTGVALSSPLVLVHCLLQALLWFSVYQAEKKKEREKET